MQAKVEYWRDTGNLDLTIIADTETERALLGLLRDRKARHYEGTVGEKELTLIFQPPLVGEDSQP